MKKTLNAAFAYTIAALCAGVFFREFTKAFKFTGNTMLAKTHPHLFGLGVLVFILVALFAQSDASIFGNKNYNKFFVLYNISLPGMTVMFFVRGILQVLETPLSNGMDAGISGIAGIFHIGMAVSLCFLMVSLKQVYAKENK